LTTILQFGLLPIRLLISQLYLLTPNGFPNSSKLIILQLGFPSTWG